MGHAGKINWDEASSGQGEPFAWLEGVSTWPTQILRVGIFMLTIALLDFGRWQLRRSIDKVAEHFGLQTLTAQEATPFPAIGGWKAKFRWLWYLETKDAGGSEGTQAPVETGPWIEYLDHARFGPSTTRIVVTSAIFFAFSIALMSLAWPHSPHRGELAAWFNHVLLVLLLGAMTALLFAALDAPAMATRLLARLDPSVAMPRRGELAGAGLPRAGPGGEEASDAWVPFPPPAPTASPVKPVL